MTANKSLSINISFFANTEDDTHCFQAAMRMILKYFFPEKDYTWEELDELTAKQPGMWTWPMAGLIALQEIGLEVINIEDFDYARMVSEGESYLRERWGDTVTDQAIKHSVMDTEYHWAHRFQDIIKTERRTPTIEDVKDYMQDGYVVFLNLNAAVLNHKEGWVGHFVVLTGYDTDGFFLHDPGLPARENVHITYDLFKSAWQYEDSNDNSLMALKSNT